MYQLKETARKEIKEKYKISYLTEKTGVTRQYISMIVNKNQKCSKTIAYYITKAINENSEINDYFVRTRD